MISTRTPDLSMSSLLLTSILMTWQQLIPSSIRVEDPLNTCGIHKHNDLNTDTRSKHEPLTLNFYTHDVAAIDPFF
jgi:hypothetical protein